MSRYRLLPTIEQEVVLTEHCHQARYVWNLAVEQQQHWQPGRRAPGYNEQCAQLTSARAEYDWLAAGSQTVQQQALRDFAHLGSGWGLVAARLQEKASGRVEQIPAAYTSQQCSACGHIAPKNRNSQAVFECEACNAGPCRADVNAARNIAAGRAVTARGDLGASQSANREPQFRSSAANVANGFEITGTSQ